MYNNTQNRSDFVKGICQKQIPFVISTLSIVMSVLDIGFEQPAATTQAFRIGYIIALTVGGIWVVMQNLATRNRPRTIVRVFDYGLSGLITIVLLNELGVEIFGPAFFIEHAYWIKLLLVIVFVREFSALKIDLQYKVVNPAQILATSFLTVIVLGGFLLKLPNATYQGISLVDAMFTSTSAVCVTGLTVVDTGTAFTMFGQTVIVILIQIGGLGIMTFASYFSYFFKNDASYKNQLMISEMSNIDQLGEVFAVVKRIILTTFIFEFIGAIVVMSTLESKLIPSFADRLFFSVFHSVSAFCNAGFSTLTNNLYDLDYRFNYPMHLSIALLIIFGGIGFPIVYNIYLYAKTKTVTFGAWLFFKRRPVYNPWLLNTNARLVLATTLLLLVVGTGVIFLFEYNNTLSEHGFWGKIVASFFGAVTPRTAGFNTVDMAALTPPAVLVVIFLMWVGASPVSTGGGIKTSSLAIAVLNVFNVVRGKTQLSIYKRTIPQTSVARAFAIIVLSIFVIAVSVLCLTFLERNKNMLDMTFECVSAYSTVGLSRGITSGLCEASKVVLIFTMFAGRVGMLTLMMTMFKKATSETMRFPTENILIN